MPVADTENTAVMADDSSVKPLFIRPTTRPRFNSFSGTWSGLEDGNRVILGSSMQETAQTIVDTRNHQLTLKDKLAELKLALEDHHKTAEKLQGLLTAAEESADHVNGFLDSCRASFPASTTPTLTSGALAEKVFATAKLLEHILLSLDSVDLLSAMQINRAASQIMADSPKLQEQLMLRPGKDGFLRTSFGGVCGWIDGSMKTLPGLSVTFNTVRKSHSVEWDGAANGWVGGNNAWGSPPTPEQQPAAQQVRVAAHFSSNLSMPKIGSACRRMLICNPPIETMEVVIGCCLEVSTIHGTYEIDAKEESVHGREDLQDKEEDAESSVLGDVGDWNVNHSPPMSTQARAGITVGNLYDAAVKLRDAHRYCPLASIGMHDSDGNVTAQATFSGKINLKRNDPYLLKQARQDARWTLQGIESTARNGRLGVYVQTKKTAYENGWPIPTYEEFKAQNAMEEDTE